MEIIKEGDPHAARLEKTCNGVGNMGRGCGTVVRLAGDDIYNYSATSFDDTNYYRTWVCPVCGNWNDLATRDKVSSDGNRKGKPPWPDGTSPRHRFRYGS